MNMDKKEFTIEHFLYLIAFLCAMGMRLIGLGDLPLSEYEASWAIQAFQVSQGEALSISGQPAYVLLTGFLFAIFKSSDAVARFLPALAGSLVICLPYALRGRLGKMTAVIFAFGLAFDPGLVAVSRIAGGPMLALGFAVLMAAAWLLEWPIAAGICAALLFMSGSSFLTGIVAVVAAWAIWSSTLKQNLSVPKAALQQAGIAAGITFLLAGTLLLRFPQGLSASLSAFPEYFMGWISIGGAPLGQVIVALLVYQALAVIFGIVALFRMRKDNSPIVRFLAIWFFVAFVLTLVYPSRQVPDLIWAVIPLWGLASHELARYLRPIPPQARVILWGQAILIFVFLTFFVLNLANLSKIGVVTFPPDWNIFHFYELDNTARTYVVRVIVAFAVPIFAAFSVWLVGSGWQLNEARPGAVLGLCIFMGLYTFSFAWSAGHLPDRAANELWNFTPVAGSGHLLEKTLGDLSDMNTGDRDALEVVTQVESDSLAWALRFKPNVRYENQLGPEDLPPMIINTRISLDSPHIVTTYRGQSLSWWVHRYWDGALPPDFIRWLLYREGPTFSEPLILWVRTDLFPGELLIPSGDDTSAGLEETP
jgi:hypothetical protein